MVFGMLNGWHPIVATDHCDSELAQIGVKRSAIAIRQLWVGQRNRFNHQIKAGICTN
jgi:hypothetical protein